MNPSEQKPKLGDRLYFVAEHRYYIPECAGPMLEYCVVEGVVTAFYKSGYSEICLSAVSPDGYLTPYYFRVKEDKLFESARDAAQRAREMTERYERVWGWLGEPDIPMRRPWEKLLEE